MQQVAMALNWSYFKPEFSGKSQENPEAYLIRTINWMDTPNFTSGQRVQRFPPTLAYVARLWYQSIYPFQGNWEELQERFRTQFSKLDNTKEHFTLMKMQKQLIPMCKE